MVVVEVSVERINVVFLCILPIYFHKIRNYFTITTWSYDAVHTECDKVHIVSINYEITILRLKNRSVKLWIPTYIINQWSESHSGELYLFSMFIQKLYLDVWEWVHKEQNPKMKVMLRKFHYQLRLIIFDRSESVLHDCISNWVRWFP